MKKTNNDGFTLVEVLIAMAILVIVSIPILVTMTDSIKLNAEAKGKQRATSIEESITERLGTYNVPEVIDQFQKTDTTKFDIVKDFTSYKQLDEHYDPTTYNLKESLDKYYFGIYGIKEGAKEYDALITYKNTGTMSKVEEVNSKKVKTFIPVPSQTELRNDTLYVVNSLFEKGTAQDQEICVDIYEDRVEVKSTLKETGSSTDKTTPTDTINLTKELKNVLVYIKPVNDDMNKNRIHVTIHNGPWAKIANNVTDIIKREHNLAFIKVNNPDVTSNGGAFKSMIGDSFMWTSYDMVFTTNASDEEGKIGGVYGEPQSLATHILQNKNNIEGNANVDPNNAEQVRSMTYVISWEEFLGRLSGAARNRMYEVNVDIFEHKDSNDFSGKKISSMTSTIIN